MFVDDNQRTRHELYELNFWLWACIHNGEAFLKLSQAHVARLELRVTIQLRLSPLRSPLREEMELFAEALKEEQIAQRQKELAKYHFVPSLGVLLRRLKSSQALFPSIKSAYSRAHHLRKEGKQLRDMIEHLDAYIDGTGKCQTEYMRNYKNARASAASLIIDVDGHWLGGRLNVERVLSELRPIAEEASKIKPQAAPRP